MMPLIDTSLVNSEAADNLVRAAVASASPGGPSLLGTRCSAPGCVSYAAPARGPRAAGGGGALMLGATVGGLCPLHLQPVAPFQLKEDASFCPNCYDAFPLTVMGLGDGKHRAFGGEPAPPPPN